MKPFISLVFFCFSIIHVKSNVILSSFFPHCYPFFFFFFSLSSLLSRSPSQSHFHLSLYLYFFLFHLFFFYFIVLRPSNIKFDFQYSVRIYHTPPILRHVIVFYHALYLSQSVLWGDTINCNILCYRALICKLYFSTDIDALFSHCSQYHYMDL